MGAISHKTNIEHKKVESIQITISEVIMAFVMGSSTRLKETCHCNYNMAPFMLHRLRIFVHTIHNLHASTWKKITDYSYSTLKERAIRAFGKIGSGTSILLRGDESLLFGLFLPTQLYIISMFFKWCMDYVHENIKIKTPACFRYMFMPSWEVWENTGETIETEGIGQ